MTDSAMETGYTAVASIGVMKREEEMNDDVDGTAAKGVDPTVESESDDGRAWATDVGESDLGAFLRIRTGESDVEGRATQSIMPLMKDDIWRMFWLFCGCCSFLASVMFLLRWIVVGV